MERPNHISFSRDYDYSYVAGMDKFYVFKIEVDGNKLSERYKITPFQSQSPFVSYKSESEEVVTGPIKDLGKYITKIIFLSSSNRHYTPDYDERIRLERYLQKYKHIVLAEQDLRGGRITVSDNHYNEYWSTKDSWKDLNTKYSGIYEKSSLKKIQAIDYSNPSLDLYRLVKPLLMKDPNFEDPEKYHYPDDMFTIPYLLSLNYMIVSADPFSEEFSIQCYDKNDGMKLKQSLERVGVQERITVVSYKGSDVFGWEGLE